MHRSALPRKPLSSTVSTAEVGTRNLTCCALCSLMRWPRRTSLFARRAPHTHPSVMGCSWPLTVSFWTALQPRASGHQLAHATATTFARPLRRAALGSPVGGGCVPAVWPPAATLRPWLIPAHRERAPVPPAQKGKAPRPPQQTASVARRRGPRRSSSNPDGAQKGTAEGALGARTVANHFAPAVGCPIKPAQSEKRRALHSKKKKTRVPRRPRQRPLQPPVCSPVGHENESAAPSRQTNVGRRSWTRPAQQAAASVWGNPATLRGDSPLGRHSLPSPPRPPTAPCRPAARARVPPQPTLPPVVAAQAPRAQSAPSARATSDGATTPPRPRRRACGACPLVGSTAHTDGVSGPAPQPPSASRPRAHRRSLVRAARACTAPTRAVQRAWPAPHVSHGGGDPRHRACHHRPPHMGARTSHARPSPPLRLRRRRRSRRSGDAGARPLPVPLHTRKAVATSPLGGPVAAEHPRPSAPPPWRTTTA